MNAEDIARRSLRKNNAKAETGNFLDFDFPNLCAKVLSFIIEAVELTKNTSNNFPINGSIQVQFSRIKVAKFEVA